MSVRRRPLSVVVVVNTFEFDSQSLRSYMQLSVKKLPYIDVLTCSNMNLSEISWPVLVKDYV